MVTEAWRWVVLAMEQAAARANMGCPWEEETTDHKLVEMRTWAEEAATVVVLVEAILTSIKILTVEEADSI